MKTSPTHGIKQVSTSRGTHASILLGRNIILIHRRYNALTCWIYIFHRGTLLVKMITQLTIFEKTWIFRNYFFQTKMINYCVNSYYLHRYMYVRKKNVYKAKNVYKNEDKAVSYFPHRVKIEILNNFFLYNI